MWCIHKAVMGECQMTGKKNVLCVSYSVRPDEVPVTISVASLTGLFRMEAARSEAKKQAKSQPLVEQDQQRGPLEKRSSAEKPGG